MFKELSVKCIYYVPGNCYLYFIDNQIIKCDIQTGEVITVEPCYNSNVSKEWLYAAGKEI